MAVVTIDGNSVPSTLTNRGDYQFPKPYQTNGQGEALALPAREITWTFSYMTQTELAFWNTTVLAGANSLYCDGTNTFKDMYASTPGANTSFSTCVLHRPEIKRIVGGLYRDVTIRITNILA